MGLSKREGHHLELQEYAFTGNELEFYLLTNSNLPSRRANLELAFAFGDFIDSQHHDQSSECLKYCRRLIADNQESNTEIGHEEFLPFCAIIGLGRIGSNDAKKRKTLLELLRINAKDNRWRIREAVAMALQYILESDPRVTLDLITSWK